MTTATETPVPTDPTVAPTRRLAASDAPPTRRRSSLGTRLFGAAALLIVVILAATTAIASWQANRQAAREIRANLEAVPEIWAGYAASQAQGRRTQVRSLVEQVGTKSLLGGGANADTYRDSAADFARGLGAATVFFFDQRGALLARSDRQSGEEAGRDFSGVAWVRDPLTSGADSTAFILEVKRAQRLSLVASAPVEQGEGEERRTVGVVAAAFPFDQETTSTLGRLASGEVALLANVAPRGQPVELAALAATTPLRSAGLVYGLGAVRGFVDTLLVRGKPFGPFDFDDHDVAYVATAVPILSASGEPLAAVVVSRSQSAQLAVFRRIRTAIVWVSGAILLLSLPVSLVMARRLARPIAQLAAGADAVRRGQLEVTLPRASSDEVGRLAEAFDGLVRELREKRALEELVATLREATGERQGADSPEIGRLFARRYRILETLGHGGMGSVFRAQDQEVDDIVAVKVLSGKTDEAKTRGEQLLRQELKLARSITHPNVVRVHDLAEVDGTRFLTMEFISGTTLRQLLGHGGRLELPAALQIAKQICRGLQAVHAAGIVHGDLKPENVMVQPNGVVKLTDFGVARARALQTRSDVAVGTPRYMSPEHARGAELDERSDLYSLGVILYEALAGHAPFEADEAAELMRLQLYATPQDLRLLRPDLPEVLTDVVRRCLAKSRPDRPASAAELERALMRVHA